MLQRCSSVEFPNRTKVYLSHLHHLIDRKTVLQPEVEVTNKLFPHRDFARKLATSHQRTKSSIQLRVQRFDVQWTARKKPLTSDKQQANNDKQTLLKSTRGKLQLPRTMSTQLAPTPLKDDKLYATCSVFPSSTPQNTTLSAACPQKNFLKRGSNIQKQIVVNLLRNKLLRERQASQRKDYSNAEIINMIQVFKGVSLAQPKKPQLIWRAEKAEPLKDIKGWDLEPFQFDDQYDKQ